METSLQLEKDAATRLDGLTPQQLVAEIRQISVQYEQEVPGRRRRWPESVRCRVLALGRLGVSPTKISELTAISRATIFLWCSKLPGGGRRQGPRGPDFVQLPVGPTVGHVSGSPTVGLTSYHREEPRVSLTAPNGFRFEFSGEGAWPMARSAYAELKVAQA